MRFLALFLEHIPEPVVEGWSSGGLSHGKRILEGYLVNLNAGTIYGNSEGESLSVFLLYFMKQTPWNRFFYGDINSQCNNFANGEPLVEKYL